MALTIIPKYSGDPLEPAATTRRLSTPWLASTVSLTDLYGYFVASSSIGNTTYWDSGNYVGCLGGGALAYKSVYLPLLDVSSYWVVDISDGDYSQWNYSGVYDSSIFSEKTFYSYVYSGLDYQSKTASYNIVVGDINPLPYGSSSQITTQSDGSDIDSTYVYLGAGYDLSSNSIYVYPDKTVIGAADGTNKYTFIYGNTEIGDPLTGYVNVDPSGHMTFEGEATVWNDIRFPATQTKQDSNDLPHFDYTNIGLLFPQNDESEKIYIIAQFNHDYKLGSAVSPHVHYRQTSSAKPTFIMQYRWYDNGEDCSIAYTTIESSTNVLPYTSGHILQMIEFPDIAGTGITGVSSIMDIILYRKTGDGVTGDVLVKEFDIHYEADSIGSNTEYTK